MTDPWRRPAGPPPIRCPVCGSDNDPSRQFCRKCASELRPGSVPPPAEEPERRISPLVLAIAGALVLLALAAVAAFALLGGGPTASPSPAPTASPATLPTSPPSPAATATAPPTARPPETPPPTTAPPATPTILRFDAPRRARCSDPDFGGTIHLEWEVAAATGVTLAIDGTGIYQAYPGTTGSDDVPFACGEEEHTYLLETTGGSGPPDSQQVTVTRR